MKCATLPCMSLAHATRFVDQYTPREIAVLARKEGFSVELPAAPQGSPAERAQQILDQKAELLAQVAWQRAMKRSQARRATR